MHPPIRLAALALVLGAPSALAQHTSAPRPIGVPQGSGTPVLLDGQLSAGEWDDALGITVDGPMRLLVKQTGGHVFLAVATGARVPRPVDVFLQDATGRVHQLHASMQIGERALGDTLWTDRVPAWRWGNHVDWIANEAKQDSEQPAERPFSARLFPAGATEFQIRRARFPGSQWRVRVEVGSFTGTEGTYAFPAGASRDTATWAVLQLH